MLPQNFSGRIGQDAQEAVVIHDGEREELVLKVDYKIMGEEQPEDFAWIVTTPSEPDKYTLADRGIFEQMDKLSQRVLKPTMRSKSFAPPRAVSLSSSGVELGKRVQVGPYDIQPVRGVGSNALEGLNNWLKKNGYPTEDPDHMKYFVKNNFTFLCVKIHPKKGSSTVSKDGGLAPLQLSFKAPKPYYPLRFSSLQGVFDVSLHVLTREPLDFSASKHSLKKVSWTNPHYKRNHKLAKLNQPTALSKIFKKGLVKNDEAWNYNHLICRDVNENQSISTWKSDVTFETKEKLVNSSKFRVK